MAEQRQPFRFRLPWLSAPPPPPPQPRPTPASATETVPVPRFLFRPPEIAQTEAPKRAEQIEDASPPSSPVLPPTQFREDASPPSSPVRPPTQFRAVFTSPLLSPRIPKDPATDSASQPQSPRLSIEATSPRTVSLPSSPAIQVQPMSQPQSPSDLYTDRQENQSPKLIVPLEEPKPVVSQQQSDPKAESKADMDSKVNPDEPSVKSNPVAISEDAKGEAKKERREIETEEKPEPVQKTITELLTEAKSQTKVLHGKLFPLNKEQTSGRKDERKERKHVKAQNSTNSKEKTSSREQPQEFQEDKASPQRELRQDISKFVHSLSTGFSSVDIPVNVVTLIGENRGASMQIDSCSAKREESIHIHRGYKLNPDESTEITSDEIESSDKRNKAPITEEEEETKTFINSNTQGINDSIVFDSSITERNPGVHLVFDSVEPDKEKYRSETLEARKAEFTISKAEKHTYEPTVRRRCLRGLLMESSDSDEDGLEQPRRHGCRYNCRDKEFGEV